MENTKKDFFISYTIPDKDWAIRINNILKDNGYTTIIQLEDFKSGENFVLNMDKALNNDGRVIAVLSEKYLESPNCKAEWTAAYTKDPSGEKGLLIPVRIEDFKPGGLFAPKIYIDLCGKSDVEVEEALLDGITTEAFPRKKLKNQTVSPDKSPPNNLPPRNPRFTGREEQFNAILANFEKNTAISLIQAIAGLGGIGKTQIALEYAFRYAYKYDYIWWVNAEERSSIVQAYTKFADKQKILNIENASEEATIEAVKEWMTRHDKWLFVFDNVNEPADLSNFRPADVRGQQHILITSRYNLNWARIATPLQVGVFSEQDAAKFLIEYTGLPSDDAQLALIKELGRLPLALDQAAAYINTRNKSYEEYLNLYRKKSVELLKKYPGKEDAGKTVFVTWNISIEKIARDSSKELLKLCSFFAPDDIDLEWFRKSKDFFSEPLASEIDDELTFDDIIEELTKYALVTHNNGKLSIHRLLQQVIKESVKADAETYAALCVRVLNNIIEYDFATNKARMYNYSLIPHIVAAGEYPFTDNKHKEGVAELYHFIGRVYDEHAEYSTALKWNEKALTIRETVLGKEHPNTATTYNNMAVAYDNLGEYDKALDRNNKALEIREKVLGKEHPDTATTYNNIALVYDNMSEYPEALEWCEKALTIWEKVLGKEHPDTATTYNNIALVYDNMSEYPLALEWHNKALNVKEKILGKEHPSTATTYNNIALVYHNMGNYPTALEWYNKALAIREKILGKEHPDTATTYNNIAGVYNNMGDYNKALEWHNKALNVKEKVLGKEHPDTATTYNNIALVYKNMGDYPTALEWYIKAYAILIKKLGTDHPNTKTVFLNMANAYEKSKNPKPFEEWLEEKLAEYAAGGE